MRYIIISSNGSGKSTKVDELVQNYETITCYSWVDIFELGDEFLTSPTTILVLADFDFDNLLFFEEFILDQSNCIITVQSASQIPASLYGDATIIQV